MGFYKTCLGILVLATLAVSQNTFDEVTQQPYLPQPPTVDPDIEPEVKPISGSWNYSDGSAYCILSVLGVRFKFNHESWDSPIVYELPVNDTSMNGSRCVDVEKAPLDPPNEVLKINFFNDEWSYALTFKYRLDRGDGDREWYLTQIRLEYLYSEEYFPGRPGPDENYHAVEVNDIPFPQTAVNSGYRCDSMQVNEVVTVNIGVRVTIYKYDTRLEAYRERDDQRLAFAARCEEDLTFPTLFPGIIGGICLTTIIAVLTIYIVQRMKRGKGYQANNETVDDSNVAEDKM